MTGRDFSFEQGVTTVPSMTYHERKQVTNDISRDFTSFYRDNYFRFASMYAGSISIQDMNMTYAEMLPTKILKEMLVGG